MPDQLLHPFQYEFMVRAILVCAFVGGVCGLLSCFIVLKGWALLGDALSHAIMPGVVVAYLTGIPFSIGAFVSGTLSALTMGLIKSKTRLREDAVIGLVFCTFFAVALLLDSIFPIGVRFRTILWGKISSIAPEDFVQMLIIAAFPLLVLALKWKDFVLYLFDPNQARAVGLNTNLLQFTLLLMLAATTIAALQAVGMCLVVAVLVTPGATAYLLTDRFSRMIWISVSIGVLSSAIGVYVSHPLGTSTGGTIVVLQTTIFLVALFFAPKHGIVAGRRKAWIAAVTARTEAAGEREEGQRVSD